MVYVLLEQIMEKQDYWSKYIHFYEKYWGGPTSPYGVWFGSEYDSYRKQLSEHLGMEDEYIEDCYFMKEGSKYYICPLIRGRNPYLISAENFIPFQWFLPFSNEERKYMYAHWGFGTIYYLTNIEMGVGRIEKAENVIGDFLDKTRESETKSLFQSMLNIRSKIGELKGWMAQYDPSGFVLLNYGELTSVIHPYMLGKELSVMELWEVLDLIELRDYERAGLLMNVLVQKWEEIRIKAEGETKDPTIQ
ncbi:MAG: hypothetical protein IH874_09690 [Candidatus Dadabacteria bacterium]|nr:hypothetical protein [Candidatus Dadabacteria bacterium]